MKSCLRLLCVLSVLSWPSLAFAQNGVPYSANVQMPTFVTPSTAGGTDLLFYPDATWNIGASGATRPKNIFNSGTITAGGVISSTSNITAGSTGLINWAIGGTRSQMTSPADGVWVVANGAGTFGNRLQFAAAPTIGSGFGSSPSVVTGATDSAFSINVGTGGAATTGVVTFNATWSVAPICAATVATGTAGNIRAMGALSTTTQVTLAAATAWVASDVVNVVCIGPK